MPGFFETNRTIIRPFQREDIPKLYELMMNKEICDLTGETYPITEIGVTEFYDKCQKTEDRIWFLVFEKETNELIGETGLLRIYSPWRTSDLSLVIWNKKYWSKGFGKEIIKPIMDYAYNDLNLHRLAIGVVGNNERALKFWKSIGFIEEGRQVEGYFKNGIFSDFVMMYQLENEYRKRVWD
jgi:diamine N-acetyltransferase